MSLGAYIKREPGAELPLSEQVAYRAFVNALLQRRTTPERAILAAAGRCGLPRSRVLAIVRKANEGIEPEDRTFNG